MSDQAMRDAITATLKGRGVTFIGLFGSQAKKTAKPDSDVDILVEFEKGKKYTLFDLGGIKTDLENKLKKNVDLVTPNSISPSLRQEIMDSIEPLYDNR